MHHEAVSAHYGVYGAWLQDGRLVTVRKSRGPYTGWLDLPGGSPEQKEYPEETLRRELREECGVELAAIEAWHSFEFHVAKSSDGSAIDLRHSGLIASVVVHHQVEPIMNREDVTEVVLLELGAAAPVTPSVAMALDLLSGAVSRAGHQRH